MPTFTQSVSNAGPIEVNSWGGLKQTLQKYSRGGETLMSLSDIPVSRNVAGATASVFKKNPIARAVCRRFGPTEGFAIVGAIELVIIGTFAIAALAAAAGDVDILGYATAVGSIIVGGLGHHLAAYGNARGRVVAVLAPIARLYAALDRTFPATGPARPALTPARRAPR